MNANHLDHSEAIRFWVNEGKRIASDRKRRIARTKNWKFDTIATHGLYDLQQATMFNNGSIIEPIFLSSAQAFHSYDEMEVALAYQMPSWTYSRIANPSTFFLEETVALLESYGTGLEAGCVACSSGMSAIRSAIEPFLIVDKSLPAPNFVSTSRVYGGTFQQFQERQMGDRNIEVRWVTNNLDMEEWASKIDRGTRFLYGEMPSNPAVALFDIEKAAALAHSHGIPLIVDATCASPALLRPLEFGADIVVQSASKIMGASGFSIVGTVTAKNHIISRVGTDEMKADFATWMKLLPYRDNGPSLSPFNAIVTLNDLRSLRSRAAHTSRSALKIAHYLASHSKVASINYPGLSSHTQATIANKYLQLVDSAENDGDPEYAYGYMMTFEIKEKDPYQPKNTRTFYNNLDMIWRATDLGRVKSVATIPAISTHQQQGDEGRKLASILPNYVRLSIGIEDVSDIITELDHALSKI